MNKTNGLTTPGGIPAEKLGNPPSNKAGPKDSGEGHLLHELCTDARNDVSLSEMHKIETQRERKLYDAWQREKDYNIKLEHTIANLQQQLVDMQKELYILMDKNNNTTTTVQQEESRVDYCTDENELVKETEWITKSRKNKKRKIATSPVFSPPAQSQQEIQSLVKTSQICKGNKKDLLHL